MKRNIVKILILILAITSVSIFSSSCYNDGDTVVKIHLVRNDLAAMGIKPELESGIIDKILNFFSTRAEAAPTWNASKSDLTLTITSDSFDTMQFTIPATATSYAVTLSPSSIATFTITSETDWGPSLNIQKNWGGHTTTELIQGNQDITIQMLPMTYISSISPPSTVTIYWATVSMHSSVISYNVYRSTSIDGNYTFFTTTTNSFAPDSMPSITYWYKVSTICDLGDGIQREGVLSDPDTW
jgi:hypothetical protein